MQKNIRNCLVSQHVYDIIVLLPVFTLYYPTLPDVVALGRAYFGSGSGEIYLDSVMCNGSEGALQQCTASPIGVHNCDHSEDAGVRCGGIVVINLLSMHTVYYVMRHCCRF